ncbi:glycosyltransferase [Bacillus tuaregi]|uniref:glycosyltransferase n=1 Tax=Bacillus tuaregi TaxID=1816695 RepID=UPI0008F96C5D|nr:glycosyltransferase [Bacillus tuaregi]
MYILIISRGYPTEKYKMNGIFEFDQAKALAKAGHKVIFAAIDLRSFRRSRHWGFESFQKDGVQIEAINIPCGNIPKPILNRMKVLAFKRLYKIIEQKYGKPIIIHAHFVSTGYVATQVFKDSKIPLVLTEHSSGINKKEIAPYLKKMGDYTYPRIDKVIAVSNSLSANIKESFNKESIVIPNIVDTNNFEFKMQKAKDGNFYFISAGSLIERKGMDLLIKSFYNAFKGVEKVKLYIYGEGPERKHLEKMIRDYGLMNRVFLMGLANRKEIAEKMSESDCFVLASRLETFGVVYIEALSMGLPVIATKCGGPEEFITEKNGILVNVDDSDQLSKALYDVYINANYYDRKNISYLSRAKFGPQTISKELTRVYESLLNKG